MFWINCQKNVHRFGLGLRHFRSFKTPFLHSDINRHLRSTFSTVHEKLQEKSTIFNISSGSGKSGVAVIRISGPSASKVLKKMTNKVLNDFIPRKMIYCELYDPRSASSKLVIDMGMAVWFPSPHSFTGEDVVELHIHGSLPVIQLLFDALSSLDGFQLSEPGEFTKRAFYAGKMDLTQIEGLGDLLQAETETQRLLALTQLKGSLKSTYELWRVKIIQCLANMEAYIDFGEDENIEDNITMEVILIVKNLIKEMSAMLNDFRKGEILRNGIEVAIIGPPNVGKSSLLNTLLQRKVSIVSPIRGTTRDVISASINLYGFPVHFYDTAGIRKDSNDLIEMEGITLSMEKFKNSALRLVLTDLDFIEDPEEECQMIYRLFEESPDLLASTLFLVNKIDLAYDSSYDLYTGKFKSQLEDRFKMKEKSFKVMPISTVSGVGIPDLLGVLKQMILEKYDPSTVLTTPLITKERHRSNLINATDSLKGFLDQMEKGDVVLGAEELRHSAQSIGKITGKIDIEEVLDSIFRDFCIGK